jgi:hypothetical protein
MGHRLDSPKRCLNLEKEAVKRFGELLRYYRGRCWDAERERVLTQERLCELLGRALGDTGYTGQAVSDWERGKSRISHDQRRVLINLIKVLHEGGGLKTLTEANTLLLAGDYRLLDAREGCSVAPEWCAEHAAEDPPRSTSNLWGMIGLLLAELLSRPVEAWRELRFQSKVGQPPDWTETLLAVIGQPMRGLSSARMLQVLLWIGVWLLGWGLTFPLLRWPFVDQERARWAALSYAAGGLIIPAFIAGLTRTHDDDFWRPQRATAAARVVRLFTHQGASVGFHVGYMMIFLLALLGYYLSLDPALRWLEGLAAAWPLVLGYAAARQVPFNLWRAFGQLRFTRADVAPTLAFVLFGPMWAAFFFASYPWLLLPPIGLALILCAFILLAAITARWERKRELRQK